jgi:gliding motility-associated-like protein
VPGFTATPVAGCSPLLVNFTNQSTNATSWQWDLGNGVTSTQQNPSTIYTNPGTYTVTLIATNASGSQTLTRTGYITVNAPPAPDFSATNTAGCFPLRPQFTDLSVPGSGTITSWSWNFGGGNTSTLQNPQFTYINSGNYAVSLTVTNAAGCSRTVVKPAFISVSPGVRADFTASAPVQCKPPEIINFTNLSTGPGTLTYSWDMGDGNTSTATNPSNNYATSGPFTVRLITTSSAGCIDTITKLNAVRLNNIQARITAPATACINSPVNFQNSGDSTPVSSTWFFGDATSSSNINPVKSYTAAGTYTVRVINQYNSCIDSATHIITVKPAPAAAFTSNDSISCRAPHTVNFQNQSTGAASWNWNFGDGGSSTQQNPSHTYTALGAYTVRLIVTNNFGCTDTLIKTNFVRLEKPVFNPLITPTEGCRMLNVNFNANSTAVDGIAQWFWDFGNGNTSSSPNTSAVFDSGTYNIKLRVVTVQGCVDSVVLFSGVKVGTPPLADFSANPNNVCAFTPTQFTDLSTGNPDEWFWIFGDGNTSNQRNPIHTYQIPGTYTVTLTAYNNRCANTITRTAYITVLPPVAQFTSTVSCSISKQRVQFTDQSVGATTWLWNFGDGNTSTLQNPVHNYSSLGTFTITLTVTNGACSNSISRTITLVDPIPDFVADRTQACKETQAVTFTSTSTSSLNIMSYLWNFGDGNTSALQNPQHVYANSGNYTVSLIITSASGCSDTIIKTNYIRINGPVAGFTVSSQQNCVNTAVSFTNTITTDGINAITNIQWQLGNGDIQNSLVNPFIYTYTVEGGYQVTQTVTDASGCSDVFVVAPVTVWDPRAAFFVDTPSCPGAPISFVNQSFGGSALKTYFWNFGDGNTSTLFSPTHTYAGTGTYTITLTVTEPIGCTNSVQKTIHINRPVASFTVNDSMSICQPFEVKFKSNSTFSNGFIWDFGDGNLAYGDSVFHFYIIPGQYRVKLTAISPGLCQDSTFKIIRLGRDTGTLNYLPLIGCAPLTVSLQTRTDIPLSYTWDLGDGTLVNTTDSNLVHTYDAGFYIPKVIIQDRFGCVGIIEGIDTIKAFGSRPDFDADLYVFCDSGTVQFSDSTITPDVITGYLWDFGDGTTSTVRNPRHFYASPGLYTVTLTVSTQSGCINTKQKPAFIKIVASPQITIGGSLSECIPASFQFTANWLNPDTSAVNWLWTIDGQTFNTRVPPQISRTVADTLSIQLIAVNSTGCRDTALQTAYARPLPVVFAGNDTTICIGSFATLNPSGANTYVWSPSTYLNCTNCTNPQATVTDNIQYTVTGTSVFGCINSDSVIVRVKKPFTVSVNNGDTLCVGDTYQLIANGAENYLWTPPAGLNNPSIRNPKASPVTTTTYTVTGFDSSNCFTDSRSVTVYVYNYPSINAGNDTVIITGASVQLTSTGSNDIISYLWTPSNTLSCSTCANPVATPKYNTTYKVEVSNIAGCTSADEITIFVGCLGGRIYIPNAFTPNNDGKNDRIYVMGDGVDKIKRFIIYNRWGNPVYSKENFQGNDALLGWDGTANGYPQDPGIFAYTVEVICGDGTLFKLKGTITLIR